MEIISVDPDPKNKPKLDLEMMQRQMQALLKLLDQELLYWPLTDF